MDFISFAERAARLTEGVDLVNPRYPLLYPLALALGARLAELLLVGKLLSVLAGAAAVAAAARWLSPAAALWLLLQPAMLQWGSTEGTDMPALALSLWAIERAAAGRGLAAGLLAGAAAMVRYPAGVVLLVVLLGLSGGEPVGRGRRLGLAALGFLLLTLPHWGLALAGLGPLLPQAGENLEIGMGGGPPAPFAERYLRGLLNALRGLADGPEVPRWQGPVLALGALGLLVGLVRRDPRARPLLALGLSHLAVLGLFFSTPRLLLPLSLSLALGLAFLPRGLVLAAAALLGVLSLPPALRQDPADAAREELVLAARAVPGRQASSSPWFYQRLPDGGLRGAVLLREAIPPGQSPAWLDPPRLRAWAQREGIVAIALDGGRVHRTYPALRPLLRGEVEGFTLLAESPGWRLLGVP